MKSQAFTLIELLVVTAIIVILTAIILPNYQIGNRQLVLQRAAHKLAQDLRMAQEMSTSVKERTLPDNEKIIPDGYGIYLIRGDNQYILFSDCDNNQLYSWIFATCNGFSEKMEVIQLEKDIEISNITPGGFFAFNRHITFTPPDPTVYIRTLFFNYDTSTITLSNEAGQTKDIIINKAGLIYVE